MPLALHVPNPFASSTRANPLTRSQQQPAAAPPRASLVQPARLVPPNITAAPPACRMPEVRLPLTCIQPTATSRAAAAAARPSSCMPQPQPHVPATRLLCHLPTHLRPHTPLQPPEAHVPAAGLQGQRGGRGRVEAGAGQVRDSEAVQRGRAKGYRTIDKAPSEGGVNSRPTPCDVQNLTCHLRVISQLTLRPACLQLHGGATAAAGPPQCHRGWKPQQKRRMRATENCGPKPMQPWALAPACIKCTGLLRGPRPGPLTPPAHGPLAHVHPGAATVSTLRQLNAR